MNSLTITKTQLEEMIAHVDALAPLEACGLLAGINSRVEKVLIVANQARSETRYAMEPIEQLHAFEWIESNGLELLGIFHSHPAGPEIVSPTDIAQAYYQAVYVVLSRTGDSWRARGFWVDAEREKFKEVELKVE
jgi:proteasome lid subunit RPN8/RPN11